MKVEEGSGLCSVTIATRKPFSLRETFGYLGRSANECLFHVEGNRVSRMIQVENQRVIVEVSGNDASLEVCFVDGKRPSEFVREKITRYVSEWLDLDTDLFLFYRQVEHCPVLKDLVREFSGLRMVGVTDLFEALCWAIMGQQINLTFAYTLKRRFVESFGEHQMWKGRLCWLFPTPDVIAGLQVADLLKLQFTMKKAEYIIGVAKRMAVGSLSKSQLLRLGDVRTMERELAGIRGVGPWTANYVLMRCLRAPSAFPVGDVGLQNAVKERLGMDRKPTPSELRELATCWAGWEAYATFYLWRSLYHTIA